MSQRSLLALSATATAFVLVITGGVATLALRSPPPSSPSGVPEEVVLAREAEYRKLIDEANARLRAQQTPAGPAAQAPAAPEPIMTGASARAGHREDEDEEHDEAKEHRGHRGHHHERDDG